MVVSELRGEKIDIIPYNEEPARFVAKALSPARVREVLVDDEERQATVIVPDDQLSLAIGREGQNARLAAKLTGWRVDIVGESEFAERGEEEGYEDEEEQFDGRCMAVLSAGRRCPNAALPGSRYCGLPTHQALARFTTNQVTVLSPLDEGEIALLADGDAAEDAIAPIVARAEEEFAAADAADESAPTAEGVADEAIAEVALEDAVTAVATEEDPDAAAESEAAEETAADAAAESEAALEDAAADAAEEEATAEGADPEAAGAIAVEVAEEVGTEAVADEDSAEDVVAEAEELADAAVEAEEPAEGSEAQ
jgi:N utilization substance protein A